MYIYIIDSVYLCLSVCVSIRFTWVSGFLKNTPQTMKLPWKYRLVLLEKHSAWIEAVQSKAASGWPSLTHTRVPVLAALQQPGAGKEEIRSF